MGLDRLERADAAAQLAPISALDALVSLVADLSLANLYATTSEDPLLRLRIHSALETATLLRNAQRPRP